MSTLAKYLEQNGTTEAAFAQRVGLSRASVNRIKKGIQWPARDTARSIYEASEGAVTEFGDFSSEASGEVA